MIIKIERSGGLAGSHASQSEIDAKDLPPQLVTMAKKIMNAKISPDALEDEAERRLQIMTILKISIYEGERRKVIECN